MEIKGTVFNNQEVELDNKVFINCTFKNCNLIYGATGPVGLENCEFENIKWTFSSYAANTLAFMQGLYHGTGVGGKKLIEETFNQIRFSDFNNVPA